MRYLVELTPEEEITSLLYAQGFEKEEIAEMKCRALPTINKQLQESFAKMAVKNGREFATKIHERISGAKLTFSFERKTRTLVTMCLLCIFSLTFIQDNTDMERRCRRRARTERRIRNGGRE